MTIAEATKEIYAVIKASTETELELTPDTLLFQDMELSSVEAMLLLADLEDQFRIAIPVSSLRNIQTVGDLCQTVLQILTQGSVSP